MKSSKHNEHVTETPDVPYVTNVDVAHETSDVRIGGIAKFVVGLSILLIVTFLLMWGIFRRLESAEKESPRSPMALSDKERLPPEPRLQGAPGFGESLEKPANAQDEIAKTPGGALRNPKSPLWEINELRNQWNKILENGPVDQNGKPFGMPIEEAKEEILKQGLPVRSQEADGRKQEAGGK